MNILKSLFSWKHTIVLSVLVLVFLTASSFYGIHTNHFYFTKPDNYILPVLSLVHVVFLYMLWFKIKKNELSNPIMRNLEYSIYLIFIIYAYKLVETGVILLSYADYESYLIPKTFLPAGFSIFTLYLSLLLLTIMTVTYRKRLVGTYHFDDMNKHVDSWYQTQNRLSK